MPRNDVNVWAASATTGTSYALMPTTGTFSSFCVNLTTPPGVGASWTWTLYKNGIDESISVTISGAETQACDWVDTTGFIPGDLVALHVTPTTRAAPVSTYASWYIVQTPEVPGETILLGSQQAGNAQYLSLAGNSSSTTDELAVETIIPAAGTVTKFVAEYVGTGSSVTAVLDQNESATSLSASLGTSGVFVEQTGSLSVSPGDVLDVNETGLTESSAVYDSVVFVPDVAGQFVIPTWRNEVYDDDPMFYLPLTGRSDDYLQPTEAQAQQIGGNVQIQGVYVRSTVAPGSGAQWAFTLRDNGANMTLDTTLSGTNLTACTTSASVSGCGTGSAVTVNDFDLLDTSVVPTGSPASAGGNGIAVSYLAYTAQLAFTTQPATGTAGTGLSPVVVELQDEDGNPLNGSRAQVTISSTPAGVSGTLTVNAVNGMATFSNLGFDTTGTYTLTAVVGGLTPVTSSPISIATELATLTSPAASAAPCGSTTFSWTAGVGLSAYWLYLGTTGVGSSNLYSSGSTTALSRTVSVPCDGVTLYVRLLSRVGAAWLSADYTFTEGGTLVPAVITSPKPGSVLGSSATFTWTAGSGPSAYWLYLGTTGVGSSNLFSSGSTTALSVKVTGLPTSDVTVYARFMQHIDGAWRSTDYIYGGGGPLSAVLTSPKPGTVLGSSATFTWTSGAGVTAYWLYLGTTGVAASDLYSSGSTTALSTAAISLPTNGVTVFARLLSRINGAWVSVDYTYTEGGTLVKAAISSPANGSVLPGANVTFNWMGGAGPSAYWLYLGTKGVGSDNLYNSGSTTATSAIVTGLPTTGAMVYAKFLQRINGVWQTTYYTYWGGTPGPATLTSPTAGTALCGSTSFTWPTNTGPSAYWLELGTVGAGSNNLYSSGSTSAGSEKVNVPCDAVTVWVTLLSRLNGAWQTEAYTFTEGGTLVKAAITSPANKSVLPGSSVKFNWAGGAGPSGYWLYLGTTGVGSSNLYNSGATTATAATVSGLPTNGKTIYAKFLQRINGAWQTTYYTYTAQ